MVDLRRGRMLQGANCKKSAKGSELYTIRAFINAFKPQLLRNQLDSRDCRGSITFFDPCPTTPIPANQLQGKPATSSASVNLHLSEPRAQRQSSSRYPRRVAIMSDIQQYLLDYDRNKKEATETAQRSAARTLGGTWWDGRVLIASRIERWPTEAHNPRD